MVKRRHYCTRMSSGKMPSNSTSKTPSPRGSAEARRNFGRSITERPTLDGTFGWDIKNFSSFFPNVKADDRASQILTKELHSTRFTIDFEGKKWCLGLKLSVDRQTWALGLFLVLHDAPTTPAKDAIYVDFVITILDTTPEGFSRVAQHDLYCEMPDWGYSQFITLDRIWGEKARFIPDNTLHLSLKFTVYGKQTTRLEKRAIFATENLPPNVSKLIEDLDAMLTSGIGTNYKISCGLKVFNVHKEILAARSSVFSRMLDTDMRENQLGQLSVTDIEEDTMTDLLKYMYTSKVNVPSDDMDRFSALARVADKYDLIPLKSYCFKMLYDHINEVNCGELAVLAHLHSADIEIQRDILTVCYREWPSLVQKQSFQKLLADNPKAFFIENSGDGPGNEME